jgi:hypothetical protein
VDKYFLASMVTDKLKKEIGIQPKPLPKKLQLVEANVPSGKVRFEPALYQAKKLKKIAVNKHTHGDAGGTVIIIVPDDDYDLPYVVVDIAFDFGSKGNIFTEFEAKPLVRDEDSMRKYADPFRKWREDLAKLPSDPANAFGEVGEFLKEHLSPTEYVRLVPDKYADKIAKFADQFFDIYLDIYRKAEPVKNPEKRKKMDTFRKEYNQHALTEDPSGVMLTNTVGREIAELFFEYLVDL